MPNAFLVSDDKGKQQVVIVSRIKGVEQVPGEPGELAVEAQEATKDDPGEPATATSPGRPPTKGHPKIEAKPAKPEKKETSIIHTEDGDIKCGLTVQEVLGRIG